MTVLFYSNDLSGTGPVWFNPTWAHLSALKDSVDLSVLAMPPRSTQGAFGFAPRVVRKVKGRLKKPGESALCEQVLQDSDDHGANILLHYALSANDVKAYAALMPVSDKFTHQILYIKDTLQPHHLSTAEISHYDLIACNCIDLARSFQLMHGVQTLYWPSHTDVLNFHSTNDYRPIDLLVVGRRDESLHTPIHRHFNDPTRDRIFLDFVTKTQGDISIEHQFQLLMTTHARSTAAFCFEPSDRERFSGRSPFLARWVHAWAAGCTVFGTRPIGAGAADQMNWDESMFDLPIDPQDAIHVIEATLNDPIALRVRRKRNVIEALRRHDTRNRLRALFLALGLELPEKLEIELSRLSRKVTEMEKQLSDPIRTKQKVQKHYDN